MAREKTPEENAADNERKQLVEEKKNLKKEQQAQRKEAKRRAMEIAKQEDELEDGNEGNSLLTFGGHDLDRGIVACCDLCNHQAGYRRLRKLGSNTDLKGCSGT